MKNPVTLIRRVFQVIIFALLMWGALIWPPSPFQPLPKIESGYPRTTMYSRGRILWVSGAESIFDMYLPSLACRFVAKGGVFKSCSLHLLSENITWRSSIKIVLPHIFAVTLLTFIFARMWCGWVCPLGAMQDAMTWLRQRVGRAPVEVKPSAGRFFFKLRHFLLWFTLAVSTLIALPAAGFAGVNDSLFLWYCQLCPARILYPPIGGVVPCYWDGATTITKFMSIVGFFSLAFFACSFVVPRLWCRVCGIGALLSYFNRGALTGLEKNAQKCTSCGTCRRVCPVDIERVYRDLDRKVVTDSECILCLRCVEECPEEGCLAARIGPVTVARS